MSGNVLENFLNQLSILESYYEEPKKLDFFLITLVHKEIYRLIDAAGILGVVESSKELCLREEESRRYLCYVDALAESSFLEEV